MYEEGIALQRVGAVRGLLNSLAKAPGPKNVLLVSSGLFQTDITGGRPDLGDLGLLVGKEAARANATIYALYVDRRSGSLASAASGRRARPTDNPLRDSAMLERPFDQIAGPSGGSVLRVIQGGGEPIFDRILADR